MPQRDSVNPRALAELLIRNHGSAASHHAELLIQETFDAEGMPTNVILRDVLKAINEQTEQ